MFGVFSVRIKGILEDLPFVELGDNFVDVVTDPKGYIISNQELFEDTYEPLATYSIHKGKEKGENIVLYINANIDGSQEQFEPYYGIYVTGEGKEQGTFDDLEEAVKQFKKVVYQYERQLVYRVYDAKLSDEDETIRFCVSSMREFSFIEEIKSGKRLIELDSMKLVHETEDRNEARSMATEF